MLIQFEQQMPCNIHNVIPCSILYTDTTFSIGINNGQYGVNGINDISCPNASSSLSQCSYGFSDSADTQCLFHYNDLRVICTKSEFIYHRRFMPT